MESSSPVITTRNLTKRFGRCIAVDDLNLTIHAGEVVAFLGSNGAGKSTVFRLLLNIYRASKGSSEILGRPSHRLSGRDFERVCYISEGLKIPTWMTGAHYVDYCSRFYPEWDPEKLQQLKGLLGVPFDQKIKHLSRGQRMKLAFLSTLPSRPQVLLLDEPFSGLDVETRSEVGGILRDLARDEGLTSLITTHDVEEVEMLANRLVLLVEGRVMVDESMSSFMGRYRKVLVASGEAVSISPDGLRLKPSFAFPGMHEGIINHFCDEWESAFLKSNPGVTKLQIQPMPLRSILLTRMFTVE